MQGRMLKHEVREYIIYGMIGILLYLVIYGWIPLDVTNDKWIYNGYAELDIVQHYAGWMEYRNSEWCWPLGEIPSLSGEDCSMYISYTDSIPLVAIICKLFTGILPSTFQYFGWYILACFALQSFFAGKIVGLFTDNKKYIYLSCIMLTVSPVLIERAFRHTALASHWLILAALYLYFANKYKISGGQRIYIIKYISCFNSSIFCTDDYRDNVRRTTGKSYSRQELENTWESICFFNN